MVSPLYEQLPVTWQKPTWTKPRAADPSRSVRRSLRRCNDRKEVVDSTISSYVRVVADFAAFFHRSPDKLGPEEVRKYLLHAIEHKKLAWPTYQVHRAALKFLFNKTLKRPWLTLKSPTQSKTKAAEGFEPTGNREAGRNGSNIVLTSI